MDLPLISQDPDEALDYEKDWTDELDGDTISTSSWAIAPTGPTVSGAGGSGATRSCTVSAVSGAKLYTLRNTVVTAGGRTYQSEWFIWGESR
jgi:hypothetical protein